MNYDAIAMATVMADRAAGDGADPPPSERQIRAVAERIRQHEIERQEREARESLITDPEQLTNKDGFWYRYFSEWLKTHPGGNMAQCRRDQEHEQRERQAREDKERAISQAKWNEAWNLAVEHEKAKHNRPRKYVRGISYQGPKHDYSQEPRYVTRSEAVERAILAGQLLDIDGTVAAVIYQHNRQTYRGTKDKTHRISSGEIAAKCGRGEATVKRSIARLLASGTVRRVADGNGNRNGAIYEFPSRSEEQE